MMSSFRKTVRQFFWSEFGFLASCFLAYLLPLLMLRLCFYCMIFLFIMCVCLICLLFCWYNDISPPWNEHNTWKLMVGETTFILGRPFFRCYGSLREGNIYIYIHSMYCVYCMHIYVCLFYQVSQMFCFFAICCAIFYSWKIQVI